MRVTLLVLSAFLSFHSAFSQNTSSGNYTRGEQITIKDCDKATDKNKCLSDLLGNAIADITNRELRKLSIQE
ncbi:MAG: hypothetical protein KJO16_10190, partial [Muriicola sp.]|nr:hypothetical protein [Muriicola sp.]